MSDHDPRCGGNGWWLCAVCDGGGWLFEDESDAASDAVTCGECFGSGVIDCDACAEAAWTGV